MWFILKSYIIYFFTAKRNFSSFSPFVQDFYNNIIAKDVDTTIEQKVKKLRTFYRNENRNLVLEDYGAGSKSKKRKNTINTKELVNKVAVQKKYGKILSNLNAHYKVNQVLELGTSLGIGSTFLSNAKVTSIEGNSALAEYTSNSLHKFKIDSVNIITAKFDDVLEDLLNKNNFELIYIDGNHTKEATIKYFETIINQDFKPKILIFDDIYWSFGMNNAWKYIKSNKNIAISIDLFKFGIVFLNYKEVIKEDIVIWA